MDHGKKKYSVSRQAPKKGPHLGLVITISVAGGVVIGSAGTHFLFKPPAAPKQSASPVAVPTPQAQTTSIQPQQQFTPAPQPPGEAPPGKVWSVEHGHWHEAPIAPVQATVISTPATVPAPAAEPAEKKE